MCSTSLSEKLLPQRHYELLAMISKSTIALGDAREVFFTYQVARAFGAG
jgi:hypothetical protein